jgi:hypothetical protein
MHLKLPPAQVTKMKMISPSNREVDVGKTLSDREWIGMCRREVMDDFLRKRAAKLGAKVGSRYNLLDCTAIHAKPHAANTNPGARAVQHKLMTAHLHTC